MTRKIPFTAHDINTMHTKALANIIVCMALEDGDLVVNSLQEIIQEDSDLQEMSPGQALKTIIGETSGNRYQILCVYGISGSWCRTTFAE